MGLKRDLFIKFLPLESILALVWALICEENSKSCVFPDCQVLQGYSLYGLYNPRLSNKPVNLMLSVWQVFVNTAWKKLDFFTPPSTFSAGVGWFFLLFVILWCLLQEEARLKTLASTSTLCTDSSLSLSSGPTSGYNSSNTATYTASNFSSQEGQVRKHWWLRLMLPDASTTGK